ncbi:MAG: helix-turn-helix domain-containing protein [Candidatus Roizmanbacteria bacterium]|nr:helix-turn-helix domain-containing protein [Candidatus Roizmanbacteria bacterium]
MMQHEVKQESQTQRILNHLITGQTLTPLEALKNFGCFRLGARIWDLKADGHKIDSKNVVVNGKHVAEYRLIELSKRVAKAVNEP